MTARWRCCDRVAHSDDLWCPDCVDEDAVGDDDDDDDNDDDDDDDERYPDPADVPSDTRGE